MIRYRIERAELGDEWDTFVQQSLNGTIFSYSHYLSATDKPVDIWYVKRGKEVKAGIALTLDWPHRKWIVLDDFVIYNGLMFAEPHINQNRAQINAEHFALTEFVAEWLSSQYENVEMRLHPSVIDIRPFLWLNYHSAVHPHYISSVRYTTILHNPTLEGMSNSRRQDILYGLRDRVEVRDDEFDAFLFADMYAKTVGIDKNSSMVLRLINLLVALHKMNMCRMFIACLPNESAASAAVFVKDNKRSYYLFGANEPELKNAHAGSLCVWEGVNRMGMDECDMEGINSPDRGYFKTSFGGIIVPYYQLIYG